MQLHPFRCSLFLSFGILILRKNLGECNPITNSNFNEHIREFSTKEDNANTSDVKTLQREDPKRYADITHFRPMLKNIPDSKLSSSSQSRGLISRDHPGYQLHDYEEYPYGYGYDYNIPHVGHEYDHHDFDHYHYGHHGPGHHYVGPHYKHYNHALSAKAVLWPIAGIALLGAAAALVHNPILLQLGVASGKRRRRDTEEISDPEFELDFEKLDSVEEISKLTPKRINKSHFQRKALKNKGIKKILSTKIRDSSKENLDDFEFNAPPSYESIDNQNYVPIPIKIKNE